MVETQSKIDPNNYVNISFSTSKWSYITAIREFLSTCLRSNSLKDEVISKVVVVASEMLENALKYNTNGNIETFLNNNILKNEIEFTVRNRAQLNDALNAIQIIEDINNAENAFLFYISRLRDKKSKTINGGGLGLARITAEASASLSINYDKKSSKIDIKALIKF